MGSPELSESLSGVGKTALGMALVRARESGRLDRLFDDPYAQVFLDAAPGVFSEQAASVGEPGGWGQLASLGEAFFAHGAIRTRFFDDFLLAATVTGCEQVVLLAAGLDTRAFRLSWPRPGRLFELDLPELFAFKERVLAGQAAAPGCARRVVSVDLRTNWSEALVAAGFRDTVATAWLAEGLLPYLTAQEAAHVFTTVGELSAPGSHLAFEHGTSGGDALLTHARALPSIQQYTGLWKGGRDFDAPDWLHHHGWRTRTHDRAVLAACYGRSAHGTSRGGFVTAECRGD